MGLDAVVYCDCFEKGKLRSEPNLEWKVVVSPDGSLDSDAKEPRVLAEFDRWVVGACPHEDGILIHHRIGNVARIARYREILRDRSDEFPMLFRKVVYSGTHSGDYLTIDEVEKLKDEVALLSEMIHEDSDSEDYLHEFQTQLSELVSYSLRIRKPISF